MRKQTLLVIVLAIVCVGSGLGLAEKSNDRPRVRLVLDSGETMDVRGPVLRHDGLVVFFTEDGMRTSIQERLVRRVQDLGPDVDSRADGTSKRSAPAARPRGQFTNQDLPVSAAPSDEDPAPEPVPLRPRTADPGAFGNDDLPSSDAAPTDASELSTTGTSVLAPAGALTNENLPPPAEAAPDTPTPAPVPAPARPGALTNEDLPPSDDVADDTDPADDAGADAEDDGSAEAKQTPAKQAEPDSDGSD